MHWNAEALLNKKMDLKNILFDKDIQVYCILETHFSEDKSFKGGGYQCFHCDRLCRSKEGILTLVRNNIAATQITVHMDDTEYQVLRLKLKDVELNVVNLYSPNDKPLSTDTIPVQDSNFLVIGDFNSHSQSWGYDHIDRRGEEVESWQDDHNLLLINNPDDQDTFYSRRWHTTSTPDLGFCTEDIHKNIAREVGQQLGGSYHRPVYLTLQYRTIQEPSLTRWNYKKADWKRYRELTDETCRQIPTKGRDINKVTKDFNAALLQAAKNVFLEVPGEAANTFAENYEKVSNIIVNRGWQREVRREERERRSKKSKEEVMEASLTLNELLTALKKLKAKKSPGPDHITNEMLTHMGSFATKTLLDVFNLSWKEGKLPQVWMEAIMAPILKRGKDKKKVASYRMST
ncbi:uncharacterized protein LOC128549389 [Mercenaria mercenaria]|uniref:uncharacterized protein LOC128549389 n=1 Tax=Mercenaria mercenaria TaxID=6596 RepID=UPI00234F6834|nr:uncharacterized protein LOC128549389 [Mercenaria mercenaria]